MNDLRTLGRAMREALEGARETILELIRARGSEAEGSDDEWVADIDAAIAAFDKALEAEEAEPQLVSEFARINEMLDEGQGDDDGPSILPKFAPGMSVVAKVESCLHLLEKRRDVIAAQAGADWRDDPSADERWNAGCDFAMEQLCAVLKVDPQAVNWDAATETLDGDVQAVLHSILTAAAPALPQGDSAGLIARLRDKWQHSEEDCYAAADALEAAEARAVEAEQWMERAAQMDNEKTVQVVDANLRAEAAERQLAAAMEALEKINVGEGWAALIARAALTGEKP